MNTFIATYNYFEIELPLWIVDTVPRSGSCDNSIDNLVNNNEIRPILLSIDKNSIAKELNEYGTWEEDELSDYEQNLRRMLWIIVGDYNDGMFTEE